MQTVRLYATAMMALATLTLAACAGRPPPATPPAPASAPVAASVPAPVVRERAPFRYTVRRGDTLWGISSRFFENPWLWPEIWYENPHIRNPHLIYPGDVIALSYVNGRPALSIMRGGTTVATTVPGTRMLKPRIERTPLAAAVPTIPYDAISALLSKPRIMDLASYNTAPYVLSPADGQLLAAAPGMIYARGLAASKDQPGTGYAVVHKEKALKDPASGRTLGYEVIYLGRAVVTASGDPATLRLQTSTREVRGGDRLVAPDTGIVPTQFALLTPKTKVHAAIIDVIGGLAEVGQYQVVVLDRGGKAGLETGDVLAIYSHGKTLADPYAHGDLSAKLRLPDRRSGELVVFRTYPELSYALVMRALRPIKIGDITTNP